MNKDGTTYNMLELMKKKKTKKGERSLAKRGTQVEDQGERELQESEHRQIKVGRVTASATYYT